MFLRLCIILLRVLNTASNDEWHLYTLIPPGLPTAHDECLYIDAAWYCRRFKDQASTSTCLGRRWSFAELRKADVQSEQLLEWHIPIVIIDTYARETAVDNIGFVCNCSQNWFGPLCTFSLPNATPLQLLTSQLNRSPMISLAPRCYSDMAQQCDSGPYCLDWRSVCDGIRQCANGEDEMNCERLEGNVCEIDEFRCRNGACIPAEFVFDGQYDCQDLSDEHRLYSFSECYKKLDFECDERLCSSEEPFSCGDGQCVSWKRLLDNMEHCKNFRDIFYRCELYKLGKLFTSDGGICTSSGAAASMFNQSDRCDIVIRKMMSVSYAADLFEFERECPPIILYPKQAWLATNIFTAYEKQRFRALLINNTYYFSMDRDSLMSHLVCEQNTSMCQQVSELLLESTKIFPFDRWPKLDTSVPIGFYRCENTTRLVHERRLNDGHIDCMLGDDEFRDDVTPNEPYRYRCLSPSPIQYVSTQQLGDDVDDCEDGSDELTPTVKWSWFRCTREDNYACALLRSASSIAHARLQFYRLCDSFWDTSEGVGDENGCLLWQCPKSLVRCNGTGQCIKDKWRCDGEFDCSDGEDERGPRCKQIPFELATICNGSTEHFCMTDAYVRQPDRHRPCVPYSSVGDQRIDCLGGHDESRVLSCPNDRKMLGRRFLCLNGTCIDGVRVCDGVEDCLEGSDEHLCTWNYQNRYALVVKIRLCEN